jgi:3-oxoacyl-[acyl-carrier protein] reductase
MLSSALIASGIKQRKKATVNNIDLSGRNAVVTGGAQGFGRAITERFIASGAMVEIWDRDGALAQRTVEELGSSVGAHAVDVTDLAAVENARDVTLKRLGRIDILINNAGIAGVNAATWETELAEWRKVLSINLDGPFICCKAIVPSMIAQNYGRIVNIASIAGKEGNPNAAHYSASKAGLIALTKSLGKELAAYNIAVNAVTPAAAKTAIFDQMTQQHIDFMLSKIPRGRFVTVEEVAALVAWMASEECSFTTGAAFDISGGRATY